MTEKVQIQVEAVDNAGGVLRGIFSQMGELGNILSGVNDVVGTSSRAFTLYQAALTDTSISVADVARAEEAAQAASARLAEVIAVALINGLKDAIETSIEYGKSVRQLALVSGESAENTSRFIQILDDYGLSADDATTATRALTKQGLAPNIETLAKLSDEYLSINDVEARNEFIIKNLGRAGLQWVDVLNQGSAALLKQGAAVNQSLILTDAQTARLRLNELQWDNWTDAVEGAKVAIGTGLLGVLDGSTIAIQKQAQAIFLQANGYNFNTDRANMYTDAQRDLWEQAKATATEEYLLAQGVDITKEAMDDGALSAEQLAEAEKAAAEAAQAMTAANNDLLSLTMNIANETANYEEQLADLTAQYGAESAEVQKLKDAHAAAFASIATDLLIAKLKADGFTDAEFQMAITMLQASGKIDAGAAQTALAMDKIAQAAQNAGTAGMASFGSIMKTVMADGVITADELQGALNTLNADAPVSEMETLSGATVETKATAQTSAAGVQSAMNAINTDAAVAEVDELQRKLNDLVGKDYVVDIIINQTGSIPSSNPPSSSTNYSVDRISEINSYYASRLSSPFSSAQPMNTFTSQHVAIYGPTNLIVEGGGVEGLLGIR